MLMAKKMSSHKGFSQQECIEYTKFFSPIAKMNSVRLIISLASCYADSYFDRNIYLRILGWTTIYVFPSTDENETSVLSTLILRAPSKMKRE